MTNPITLAQNIKPLGFTLHALPQGHYEIRQNGVFVFDGTIDECAAWIDEWRKMI